MLHSAKMADVRPRPSKELTHRSRGQGLEFEGSEDWYGSSSLRLRIVAELQRVKGKSTNANLTQVTQVARGVIPPVRRNCIPNNKRPRKNSQPRTLWRSCGPAVQHDRERSQFKSAVTATALRCQVGSAMRFELNSRVYCKHSVRQMRWCRSDQIMHVNYRFCSLRCDGCVCN